MRRALLRAVAPLVVGLAVVGCRMPVELPERNAGHLDVLIGLPEDIGARAVGAAAAASRDIGDPLTAQNVLIRITAADMETVETVVSRESVRERITRVELTVPAGLQRRIFVSARNSDNHVLYSGATSVNLSRGETRRVSVVLERLIGPVFEAFGFATAENPSLLANRSGAIDDGSVDISVSQLTDVTSLVPRFVVADGVRVFAQRIGQVSGETSVDFSQPVRYILVSPTGGVSAYRVTVGRIQPDDSAALGFQGFGFRKQGAQGSRINAILADRFVAPEAGATSVEVEVADIVDVSSLTPDFAVAQDVVVLLDGVEQEPGAGPVDFSQPVTYTLGAPDGRVTDVTVTVNAVEEIGGIDSLNFGFVAALNPGELLFDRALDIAPAGVSVTIGLHSLSDATSLVPTYDGQSGVRAFLGLEELDPAAQLDFEAGVTLYFVDIDGNTIKREISTSVLPDTGEVSFQGFGFPREDGLGNSVNQILMNRFIPDTSGLTNFTIEVAAIVDRSDLIATFDLEPSVVALVDGVVQLPGASSNDFTNTLRYTLAGRDGEVSTVDVTVGQAAENADIPVESFDLLLEDNNGTILVDRFGVPDLDRGNAFDITVSDRANRSALVPTFSMPDGVRAFVGFDEQTPGVSSVDFSAGTVEYRFVDDAGGIAVYTVTVTTLSSDTALTLTDLWDLEGLSVAQTIERDSSFPETVRVTVPPLTDLTQLAPVWQTAEGAQVIRVDYFSDPSDQFFPAAIGSKQDRSDSQPESGFGTYNFAGPVVISVQAEDGYTIRETTIHTYYGDRDEGTTGLGSTGIFIPDYRRGSVAIMDDLREGTAPFGRLTGDDIGISGPIDIDYDAGGSMYVAGESSVEQGLFTIHQYPGHFANFGGWFDMFGFGEFITVDRIRDRLYMTSRDSDEIAYFNGLASGEPWLETFNVRYEGDRFELATVGGDPPSVSIYGAAVDELGYLYVVVAESEEPHQTPIVEPGNHALLKILPDASGGDFGGLQILDSIALDGLPEFAVGYGPGRLPGDVSNYDLLYREGNLYLLNGVRTVNGEPTGLPAVLKFATAPFEFTDTFGYGTDSQDDGSNGAFLGPRRFAAVMNRSFIIIDEETTQDRVVYFDSIDGGFAEGWGTYGRGNTSGGAEEYRFFTDP